jgi:UDP-N-acetylmuramoyl-L-alanyl-D-glutamate--2,6-diaminopimelate ligase
MTFDELMNLVSADNAPDVRVDSRLVRQGDIFVAVEGTVVNGHDFIQEALARGAKYIVRRHPGDNEPAETITVRDSAEAAALLAQASKGNPASQLTNLAVTGTNGKTTVAFLVRSVIREAGLKCGLIGTVLYDTCSGQDSQAPLTTPDSLTVAKLTRQMVENGAEYMVIEASSHALSQSRLAGISFRAAAFTNLAGDHLDYHKTKQEYLAAKTRLFEALSPDATAVLNRQSQESELIAARTSAQIMWYAIDEPADLVAHVESMDSSGTSFAMEWAGKTERVRTPLPGRYNISNSLAAAGLCLAADFSLDTVAAGLSARQTIPGRLERIDWPGDFSVLIDYAHSDDALKNVLSTLKCLCVGKLRVAFGCGGDRDRTKRPRMAAVAEELADFVIVTSDNPRTERPDDIIADIVAGFKNPRSQRILVEADRKKAIGAALEAAEKGDIVLIAGKGHETYQIIGTQRFDFNDKHIALEFLKRRT